MSEVIKVTVSVDDRKITLEGPEEFVQREVQRLTAPGSARSTLGAAVAESSLASPASFFLEKKPKGHSETIAVLGFFLRENGTPEFDDEAIRRAYIQAKVRPPKAVQQALRDAMSRFDYLEKGSRKGTFKLSDHGDRTVRFDLPRNPSGDGKDGGR